MREADLADLDSVNVSLASWNSVFRDACVFDVCDLYLIRICPEFAKVEISIARGIVCKREVMAFVTLQLSALRFWAYIRIQTSPCILDILALKTSCSDH